MFNAYGGTQCQWILLASVGTRLTLNVFSNLTKCSGHGSVASKMGDFAFAFLDAGLDGADRGTLRFLTGEEMSGSSTSSIVVESRLSSLVRRASSISSEISMAEVDAVGETCDSRPPS